MNSMSMSMTGSAAPAATSSSSMGMGSGSSGMDSMSMPMSMADMMMVFFTSTTTPLYSMDWTPTSTGQYAGTCIFLTALAAIFRAILAIRTNFFAFMAWLTRVNETDLLRSDGDKIEVSEMPSSQQLRRRTWRTNESLVRALLDTVLAGVSYLLMLAVMTMNVGYFMSILGGTFLGSFIFGGLIAPAAH